MSNAVLLLTGLIMAQLTAPARIVTRALTPSELASSFSLLDRRQIANFTGKLQIQRQQAFSVQSAGGTFRFEPAIYEAKNTESGNDVPRCGVFVLRANEKAAFVPTLGSTWTEMETCTALAGVGFAETGAEMPRILLLYDASSPNYTTREPIVLDWDASARQYRGNKELSLALTHKGGNASIAGMKRRIAEIAAGGK